MAATDLKIYIKEYNDTVWTDITARVVKANFNLRSGFSSLGGAVNLSKLDITYRASDLAVAAIFHTTAKQIRIRRGGASVWEGYTEGAASVTSTAISSLAWVKITAYPYLHALEGLKATADEVYYNVYMSQPASTGSSLLHILWNNMLSKCDSPYKESLKDLYTVAFPTIAVTRDIAVIKEGEEYLSVFLEILKQYAYVLTIDGFKIDFVQPYADDYRSIGSVPYTAVQTNPTIKTAPYKVATQPVVTLTRIKTVENCQIYSLAESDTENAEEELYIGMSHPQEGDYEEITYSNDTIETDTCRLIYANTPSMTYKARYSDNSGDAILRIDKAELGGTGAKIKLTNTSTVLSCYLNQLWIHAARAYFEDTSIQVTTATVSKGEKDEQTTEWLSDETNATVYMNALISEQKADTSTLTFKSEKLGSTYKPNDLIKIGGISAVYLIKQVSEDIATGEKEYTCGLFKLTQNAAEVYKKAGKNNRGSDGASYQFVIESTAGTLFKSDLNTTTILVCRIYKSGSEEDAAGLYTYTWARTLKDGSRDGSFTPERPSEEQLTALGITLTSYKAILVHPQTMDELNTYTCEVES